ncbi:MAG: serine/threonine protein kinase [Myxococcota bacterium]|nr:serine/threonine protein kinase [Myxococcota bacterium]
MITRTPAEALQLQAGSALGHYQLVGPIARGASGTVYEAVHRPLGRRVAIKILHARAWDGVTCDRAMDRCLREARAATQVRHPHIVDVFDFGMDRGIPFLVMELLEGGSLARLLSGNTKLPLESTLEIILPILSAVAELHAAGIVHRDIKPENILLAQHHGVYPKLADFGVSRWDDGSPRTTRSGELIGTPDYMPPELLRGRSSATEWTDQYSLGVVLYECATGQRPFQGMTPYDLMHAIVMADIVAPSAHVMSLPKDFDDIVMRSLHHDPRQRFASIDEFGEALLQLASPTLATRWRGEFVSSGEHSVLSARPTTLPVSATRLVAPPPAREDVPLGRNPSFVRIQDSRIGVAGDQVPGVETHDGVAVAIRGDVLLTLWNAPARVHRTKWFFDFADRLARQSADGILALMVLLPEAAPPDGPARQENARRLRALSPSVRLWVTVAIGDDIQHLIARAVIRMMGVVQRRSSDSFVTRSIAEGTRRLLEAAGPATPSSEEVDDAVNALFAALAVSRNTEPKSSRSGNEFIAGPAAGSSRVLLR